MDDCIFCKIVRQEIPAELVQEEKDFIVFKDINPQAPIHLLLIPKKHIESLAKLDKDDQLLIGTILFATKSLAERYGISDRGYRVVINCGLEGGQLVPHLHFHFLGNKKLKDFA